MQVGILGPLAVDGGGIALAPRDRVVLAALAARAGERIGVHELAAALWAEDPPVSWPKIVPGCVMRLRRVLGSASIETAGSGYRLVPQLVDLDSGRFERQVARAHELMMVGEPDRAAYVFAAALDLWRGEALPELVDWAPGKAEASRLQEVRSETVEALLDARLQSGMAWEVVGDASAGVIEEPLRERRWALLAQALYRSGRQGDALLALRRARETLAAELGLDPGPGLAELEKAMLRQDPALMAGATFVPVSVECPYFGLSPAGVDDTDLFFGRERETRAYLDALVENGALVIAGPSGVGKSSIVRAGIAAGLRAAGRAVTVMTPGAHPLASLESSTGSWVGRSGALIVDQCEEALALCDDAEERRAFFAALVERAERELLIVVLRADRLGDLVAYPEFARLVERTLVLLGPLSPDGLRAVVELPARHAGLLVEPGLVDVMMRDAAGEPGALPLLSHALWQTWARREGRTLTVAGYARTGGIQGAVAQSAEAVYEALPDPERATLRALMLRLIEPGERGAPVRLRLDRTAFAADPAHERLVDLLVDARLLTSDDGRIEMAHEALARAWPRLRDWLEQDIEGQRTLRHLMASASGWEAMGRPDGELYRGPRLSRALAWRDGDRPELTAAEHAFLDASRTREDADLAAAQERLRHEQQTVRRQRWLTAAAAGLAVVAVGVGGVALVQRERADDRAMVAEARRVAAVALVEPQFDRALLLAVEAVHLWDSPETRGNLLNTIERSPFAESVTRDPETGRILQLDLSLDGSRAVVVDGLENVTLFDMTSREPVGSLRTTERSYLTAALSRDGSRVAVTWTNPECWIGDCREVGVAVHDSADLAAEPTILGGFDLPVAHVAFSPDGSLIAAVAPLPWYEDVPNVAVWELARPAEPRWRMHVPDAGSNPVLTPDRHVFGTVAFSPRGELLYVSGHGPTAAFDMDSGEVAAATAGDGLLALSADGAALALSDGLDAVRVVAADGTMPAVTLPGQSGAVLDAAFSPDGRLVATVGNDQTAVIWDRSTGERRHVLAGHVGAVHAVEFDADGRVLTAGAYGTIVRWDLGGGAGLSEQLRVGDETKSPLTLGAVLAPDGDRMAILREGSGAFVAVGSALPVELEHDTAWAAFHPDGTRVATVGVDGAVRLWDARTGAMLAMSQAGGAVNRGALAFLADGEHIVAVDETGLLSVLDSERLATVGRMELGIAAVGARAGAGGVVAVTGQREDAGSGTDAVFVDVLAGRELHRLKIDHWSVRASFDADGTRWAFGGGDGAVGIVDVASGTVVTPRREPVHSGAVSWVAFSPDGSALVSAGFDGEVAISGAADAAPYARFSLARAGLGSSAVFRDDHTIVVGQDDGSIVAYELDPRSWERHACAVAGRDLTAQEWREAFGDRAQEQTCAVTAAVG